jgi:hypothetical protein
MPREAPKRPDLPRNRLISVAGAPSVLDEKPHVCRANIYERQRSEAEVRRHEAIVEEHLGDFAEAAELLRQTHAARTAAREIEHVERLKHHGLSAEQIEEVMAGRQAQIAQKTMKYKDHHQDAVEELTAYARSKGIVHKKPTESLATRKGLLDPGAFTERDEHVLKRGLVEFAKRQIAPRPSEAPALHTRLAKVLDAGGGLARPNDAAGGVGVSPGESSLMPMAQVGLGGVSMPPREAPAVAAPLPLLMQVRAGGVDLEPVSYYVPPELYTYDAMSAAHQAHARLQLQEVLSRHGMGVGETTQYKVMLALYKKAVAEGRISVHR